MTRKGNRARRRNKTSSSSLFLKFFRVLSIGVISKKEILKKIDAPKHARMDSEDGSAPAQEVAMSDIDLSGALSERMSGAQKEKARGKP